MRIPFNLPYLTGQEEHYLLDALKSLKHCGNHGYCQRVLERMKADHEYNHMFLTPSCTSALEMGAMLLGIGPGDEVILPSYTFSSTANAVVMFGAKPIFCEIDPTTCNMDPRHLKELLHDRTKLVLPIDYAGMSCDIDEIRKLAHSFGAAVMQDSAQSYGSYYNGKACGTVADLACFSFHETKNFSSGEGGALLVNNDSLLDRAYTLQEKGTNRRDVLLGLEKKYNWVDLGSSYLLSDLLAAVLLAQLEAESLITEKRRKVCDAYFGALRAYADSGAITIHNPNPNQHKVNHHAFWVIFDSIANKDRFLQDLLKKEISAYIGYVPLHSSPMGRRLGYKPEDLPITESIGSRIVRLPLYAELADVGLEYCVGSIGETMAAIYG